MKVINQLMPSVTQRKLLAEPTKSGPVFMINLIRFREKAMYEDGRSTNTTGKEAYRLYGQEVVKILPKFNAEVVFHSHITALMIGIVDELWDEMSVVKYASRQDLNNMTTSAEWTAINAHRLAGIKGQLNIESIQG